MNFYTIKAFSKAVIYGSKYVYQTVPRLLTIWMDVGEDPLASSTDQAKKMSDMMAKVFDEAPVYKVWRLHCRVFLHTDFVSGTLPSLKLSLELDTPTQTSISCSPNYL